MKRGFWIFAVFILVLGFISADSFSFTSGNSGISIGGLSGSSSGFFTSPNSSNVTTSPSPTPTPTPASSSGGSGGGGIVQIPAIPNLVVNPSSFNLPASVGIESSGEVMLKNNGTEGRNISVTLGNVENIISFNNTNIVLSSGESKILSFSINPPEKAGIYSGKIFFSSGKYQTVVPIAINVGQGQSLFDIFVKIPQEYRVIQQGEDLVSNISLVQKGAQKKTDVTVQYTIQDFSGNIFSSKTNTVAVYNEKDYQEVFNTSSLSPGSYLVGVKALYSGGIATASSTFTVKAISTENETNKTSGSASGKFFSSIGGFFKGASSGVGQFFSSIGTGIKSFSGKIGNSLSVIHFGTILVILCFAFGVFGLFLIVRLVIKNFYAWKSKYKIWKYSR